MTTMTKAAQQTAVGEGLALGCVALGRTSFNGQKMVIELAFVHAWKHWPYSSRFPAVRADLDRNDLLGIIRRNPRRRSARLASWTSEWPFVAALADGWDVDEVAELLAPNAGVPLAGWRQLAEAFLERVGNSERSSR